MDQPTEDEVLAARTPAALFGDAARELASLKRAYAALVRRFRPESSPAVFAHVHALFTAARDALEGDVAREALELDAAREAAVVPTARSTPLGRPGAPAPAAPRTPSEAALHAVETWLDDETAARRDALWWRELAERLRAVPWSGGEALAARALALLDEAPPSADAAVQVLARRAARRLAWARASRDPQVPRLILDTLAACEEQPAATTVRALAGCAERLHTLDVDAVQRHLERRHPTLVAMLHDALLTTQRWLGGAGWNVALSTHVDFEMRQALTLWGRLEQEAPRLEQTREELWLWASNVWMAALMGVAMAGWLRPGTLWVVALAAGLVRSVVAQRRLASTAAARRETARLSRRAEQRARLERYFRELAIESGLFADELAAVLARMSPPGDLQTPPDHPALWFVLPELQAVRWVGARQVARVVRAQDGRA